MPIIYGGFAGCAYALSGNGKMYKDYSQAYLDIMDSNPNTKSYEDLLPPNSSYNEEQLKSTLKRRKINHVLGIKEDRYELAEDFGIK